MPHTVTKYQPTPNPNALKCFVVPPVGDRPRSFRKPEEGAADPTAAAIFAIPGISSLLLSGDWLTVNKSPEADWAPIKKGLERALAQLA
jgi:hypothetical protein